MSSGRAEISVCLVCRDEADRLPECLESVGWADEILVMDLDSSDDSAAVARQYGARVLSRAPHPIVEPLRNELADAAAGPWILALDPDERVSPGLARELRRAARDPAVDAVVVPRMNFDLGHSPSDPLHRYEPQLRMYRKACVRWPEEPNALPEVPETRLRRLPARDDLVLLHDRNRSISEALERAVRYAPAEARDRIARGEEFTAARMAKALGRHAYRQFLRGRPWRDGVPGLLRAGILVSFHFYSWAAFWHLSRRGRHPEDDRTVARWGVGLEGLRRLLRLAGAPRRWLRAWRRDPE